MSQATLDILDRFHHLGLSAYEGAGVAAAGSARERLASNVIHTPFSLSPAILLLRAKSELLSLKPGRWDLQAQTGVVRIELCSRQR
jgi:hypothetical protein